MAALNATGTFRRAADEEGRDVEQMIENVKAESWRSWPNEAGFVGLEEHRGPIDLKVKGHIPSWAAGSLFRTGPGQSIIEDTCKGTYHVSHWFDGFAHTHKFDIIPSEDPGTSATVRYSSRRQAEDIVEDIKTRGWRASLSFAQKADPCVGIFGKMMATFRPPIPANCNVTVERNLPGFQAETSSTATSAGHRTGTNNIILATDGRSVQEIHPETLEPIRHDITTSLHPVLNGPMSCAHPQRDPQNGDLFNFNLAFGMYPTYRVFRVSASTGKTDILATIPIPELRPAYIHSIFLTKSYVVLCVPSTHLGWSGIKVPWEGNIVEAIEPFEKSKLTQWVVIDRCGNQGVVARFTTPAGFFFHSINAFEEQTPDGVALNFDYIWYENLEIINSFYHDVLLDRKDAARKFWIEKNGFETCRQYLTRCRFTLPPNPKHQPFKKSPSPLPSAEIPFSIPAPHCGELPTINPARATRPYRYVYTTATRGLSTNVDALVKTDLQTREAIMWAAPKGHTPGEAIFVARPDGTGEEDDGMLLSVVLDGTAERSYLLVLDASTMEEVGRAEADFAVAIGFHGVHALEVKT